MCKGVRVFNRGNKRRHRDKCAASGDRKGVLLSAVNIRLSASLFNARI